MYFITLLVVLSSGACTALRADTVGITRYFYVEMRRNRVFTKPYTVNVCFSRLGWLSDIRVSNKMISLKVT